MTTPTIEWNRRLLEKFRAAHERAIKAAHSEFTFQDHEFDVGYARYLIEY